MTNFFRALSALCFGLGTAHFQLRHPQAIGSGQEEEETAPCGGATPDFSGAAKLVDFHVGGEALAMRLTHQQSNWLFRATTDQKAESGWEQLFPIVMQSGLGDFCEPSVAAPSTFAGKKGVVSVVSSAVDGLLYQCVAVNFVQGSANRAPPECKNSSSVQASFVNDDKLSALVGKQASVSASSSRSSTAPSAAATSTSAAASNRQPTTGRLGWNAGAAALVSGALLGGALLLA
ncbi:hypothetical protein CDD83_10093 [Cordyceps sp. RAO-2017]|nr:hypothetical protein CDD83_10093 [Cordyceps sp. RAO-2017]